MKRRSNVIPAQAGAVRTGEHCPATGWWYPASGGLDASAGTAAAAPHFIGEGSLMPAINGIQETWLPNMMNLEACQFQELPR